MVLSLSKVVKDIMLVGGSTLFLGERLTPIQSLGYAIGQRPFVLYQVARRADSSRLPATSGLVWYKITPT